MFFSPIFFLFSVFKKWSENGYFIVYVNYKNKTAFSLKKNRSLLISFYLTAYVLTSEKLSVCGVKIAALEHYLADS